MDYIQEMLLNQKEMLAALMLGNRGSKEFGDEVEAESTVRQETGGESSADIVSGKEQQAELYRGQRKFLETERTPSGYSRKGLELGAEKQPQITTTMETYAVAGMWDGLSGTGSSGSRAADAKRMSRAIQRDARRYDGGFSIY